MDTPPPPSVPRPSLWRRCLRTLGLVVAFAAGLIVAAERQTIEVIRKAAVAQDKVGQLAQERAGDA
ncbi:MAG: hypothetical protein ACKOTF_09715, partial [Opitutaceae bacterium]